MFSRVGRLTTFGAQAVSNCPFRRENIYQQPLKVTAPINDQLVNFAHNFSDSLRPRTTSFGNDPFLGVPMDDEEVIKELELLDLDSWHTKPRPPCAAPSDELDVDQFWDGKNVTLEAWRPTDTWNAPGAPHQQQQQQQQSNQPPPPPQPSAQNHLQQGPVHSSSEMMHDFSNFGDNMGSPLFQSSSKSSVDQFTSSHSQNHGHSRIPDDTNYFSGPHAHAQAQQQNQLQKVPKFEMDVENASKAVDWDAWNHYLDDDDAFKRPESFFTSSEDSVTSSALTTSTSSPDSGFDILDIMAPPSTPALAVPMTMNLAPVQSTFQNHHLNLSQMTSSAFRMSSSSVTTPPSRIIPQDIDLFSSGPLICVPKEEIFEDFIDKDDDDYIPASEARRQSQRLHKPLMRHREESERSWTPASDDFYPEEKAKFKKRGVVLKPSVDDETDRRRALNRVAAVRYREKKRAEKMGRKREFQDVIDRNRILIQKERQLKREISQMKKELRKMGAIVH